jgi:hypothetical protein
MTRKWLQAIRGWLLFSLIVCGMNGCRSHHDAEESHPNGPTLPATYTTTGNRWQGQRFIDQQNGAILDLQTHILWLKEAECFGPQTQTDARYSVMNLAHGQCGLTDHSSPGDWRLPTVKELLSVIDYTTIEPALQKGYPFQHVLNWYWSATPFAGDPNVGWVVDLMDGDNSSIEQSFLAFSLPVRGNVGIVAPGLINNQNGTITDTATGLTWLQNADCFDVQVLPAAVTAVAALQSGECGLSDHSHPGDWRLPTITELLTLIDYSEFNPALPKNHPFENVRSYYWSTTISPLSDWFAWNVYLGTTEMGNGGDLATDSQDIPGFILPLRKTSSPQPTMAR